MMTANCCRSISNYVGFGGEPVQRFVLPQAKWPFAPILWTLFRYILAIYVIVWFVLVIMVWGEPPYYRKADSKAKFLIYVSYWAYIVLILYTTVMALGNMFYHTQRGCRNVPAVENESRSDLEATTSAPSHKTPLPWYFKLAWFLQTVAFASGLFVTINFYLLVYTPGQDELHVYALHIHGVNLVIILLDVLLSATPMRVMHLIYPTLFALIYFLFTLIYQQAGGLNEVGGTYIYPNFLDWGAVPGKTVIVVVLTVLLGAPLVHLVWYVVYRVRRAIAKYCTCCCRSY